MENPFVGVLKFAVPLLISIAVLPVVWFVARSYWQGKPELVTWGNITSQLVKLSLTQILIGAVIGGTVGAAWAGGLNINIYLAAFIKWFLGSIAASAGITIPE